MPDNVLFEGGAGETVRRKLINECESAYGDEAARRNLLTPRASSQCVLFFDCRPASETPWTKTVWFYDFRTNMDFTSSRIASPEPIDEFVACFNPANRHERKPTWSNTEDGGGRTATDDEINNNDATRPALLGILPAP